MDKRMRHNKHNYLPSRVDKVMKPMEPLVNHHSKKQGYLTFHNFKRKLMKETKENCRQSLVNKSKEYKSETTINSW